ncbi:chloride channel protein [Reyranella sp.]|uniref:chloride channel protein n=1 Tax=Reyranella sp. TaxID=1929291 RepID=UPI003BAD64DF
MQSRLRSNDFIQILVCAAFGAVVGALVAGVHALVDLLHETGFRLATEHSLSTGIGVDPQRILVIPLIGGLLLGLSALVGRRFRPKEVVDPIEANALHGGRLSLIDSLRLLVSTIISNASGVAVGMEAGYAQLGSGVLSKVGQLFRLRRSDLRIFVGAGAAAAIAAAFNAPLAGAFYGYELILGSYSVQSLAPVAAAALTSTLTLRALMDPAPLFDVGFIFPFSPWLYLAFALLGILSAGFAVLAMQAVTWAERGLRRLPLPPWLRPAVGGLLVSAIALLVPQVLGSGHGAIQLVFDSSFTLPLLLVLLAAKLLASALSLGAGFRGGLFSASLFLGCLFGAAFADVAGYLAPHLVQQHATLMMVGMASVAAGVIGAPLTMMFLVLEGTGNFPLTVGVMVGVVFASTIVRLTFGYSFSTWRFHQRGLGIRSPHDVGWLADLTVSRLMRADPKTVPATMPIDAVREKFPLGSAKRVFVVDGNGAFAGTIDISAVHEAEAGDGPDRRLAGDLAADADLFLLPYDNVRTALARFEQREVETLPVLASVGDRSVAGYLTEQFALRRYNQELERRRTAELGERDLFSISEPRR